ncbi:xanthotoxin 5-hydroxylase CYP82C4-like [Impatiens glandulifera]|uniref:xanthotoxin 5-hydroxylase CYP82C4-like n=1 Tax=Impatiens glandulifera TaxID=253017 RepID=UPI001FB154E1|nr:xanthotoxin 5-hydroxylase CYP82C4-like [Impatiens glandulifera]
MKEIDEHIVYAILFPSSLLFLQFQVMMIITIILLLIISAGLIINLRKKMIKRHAPPQPAGSWPLIGHLHLLMTGDMIIHEKLGLLSDKYGPTFSLRLGFHETLVVNNWQVAKECFTTNDVNFATRPKSLAMKIMAYNQSMIGTLPYGPYWRSLRKFIVIHLLSNHRLQMLKHVRFSEIDFFTKTLYQMCHENGSPVLVDLKEKFSDMTTNIITRIIAGKRYAGVDTEESKRFQKAFGEFTHLSGLFVISDAIPFLGMLDVLNGNLSKMKRVAKEVDNVFSKWVNEHRLIGEHVKEEENDLIHVMLAHLKEGDLANIARDNNIDNDTIIKSTCMGLVLGGNDTTSTTMIWALCFVMNNREVLQKAQEELDTHVGKLRLVEESDIHNLVYLQAIFKETLRLQPTVPLLVPREAMEDCNVAGFGIRAGTRLLVNAWKMHRDPSVWSESLAFKPERFLMQNKKVDVTGKSFELLPFGCGRRMCPGITFSQQIMHLALARLLQVFELDTVGGLGVDMTETSGLTIQKTKPLEVLLTPRLSEELIMNGMV